MVRVKSANSPTSEFRRPLQRLYPLEVNAEPDNPAPHAANIPIRVVRDDDIPNVVVNTCYDGFLNRVYFVRSRFFRERERFF